jgi:hypothetical protein
MNAALAYKAGDVPSGNWSWAVGIEKNGRMMQIATVNIFACHALGWDHEKVAEALANGFNEEFAS